MSTLITGGGSNIGTHLALQLQASGREAIFASRSGNRIPAGFKSVKLDWSDPSTFEGALNASPNIEYVYVLADPAKTSEVIGFVEAAVKKGGVKKFVNLSATRFSEECGTVQIPKYLKENGINHVILRPTWFIDNLAPGGYLVGALEKGQFETVVPTGRIPFVATEDIARAAFKAITEDIVNKDIVVLGPELLTYDEYAQVASKVLQRTIIHKPVSTEQLLEIKGSWAKWLIGLELEAETIGFEERWWHLTGDEAEKEGVEIFKGKTTVREWVEKNKSRLA